MEGRRDEYLSNKGRVHAMFVECLESVLLQVDSDVPIVPPSLPSFPSHTPILDPPLDPSLDSDIILPPTANLCVASFPANLDVHHDLYFLRDPKFTVPFAYTSADFQSTALLSMTSLFNTLLDSGCTHHIIRDCSLFQAYVVKDISVGTANCGSLEALGCGDVTF